MVLPRYDVPFCSGDCTYPMDLAASTRATLYPNARAQGSRTAIVEKSGHCINAHYSAPEAYIQIADFLKANGL